MLITPDTTCWPTVVAYLSDRVLELHLDLETAPAERIGHLQGQLAEIRLLIAAATPPEPAQTGSIE